MMTMDHSTFVGKSCKIIYFIRYLAVCSNQLIKMLSLQKAKGAMMSVLCRPDLEPNSTSQSRVATSLVRHGRPLCKAAVQLSAMQSKLL
jgi:hypothetical protein